MRTPFRLRNMMSAPQRARVIKMSAEEIKAGDVVVLKSGGPKMTVSEVGSYGMTKGIEKGAKCTWFDKTTLKEEVFHLEAIKIFVAQPVSSLSSRMAR